MKNKWLSLLVIFCGYCFCTCYAFGLQGPLVAIPKIKEPPIIDGSINEGQWSMAAVLDGFEELDIERAPRERTRAWICYDNNNIYIAIRCWTSSGNKLRAEVTEHDGTVFTDDCVEVFLDPGRKGNYKHFVGNSIGTQYEAVGSSSGWNAQWLYSSNETSFGWEAEMAIPFKAFECLSPTKGSTWGLLIGRTVQNPSMQFSQWGNCKTTWHSPKNFGTIIFAKDTARILPEMQACGQDIDISLYGIAPKGSQETIKVKAVLRQVLETSHVAEEMATVMVFNDNKGQVVGKIEKEMILNSEKQCPIELPSIPDISGSFDLELNITDLAGNPILIQTVPLDRIKPIEVKVNRIRSAAKAEISVNIIADTYKNKVVKVNCSLIDSQQKIIWQDTSDANGVFEFVFDKYDKIEAGHYQLEIAVLDKAGREVVTETIEFKKSKSPVWLNNDLGKEEKILAPLTPIELINDKTLSVWGRRYVFSPIGLPEQIIALDNELLLDPARLSVIMNGESVEFIPDNNLRIEHGDLCTIVKASSHLQGNPAIKLEVINKVEYDGFAWMRLQLSGPINTALDKFWLEFPLNSKYARYHLPVFNDSVSIDAAGMEVPIIPRVDWKSQKTIGLYWVGNEDFGFALSAESDRYWTPANRDCEFALVPDGDRMIWRSHLADKHLDLEQSPVFEFCWMATPIQDVPNWHNSRAVTNCSYKEAKVAKPESDSVSFIQSNYNRGIRVQHYHEPWTEIMGYPGTFWYQDDLKELMVEASRVGMKIALYSHPVISSIAPEFDGWGNDFSLSVPMQAAFNRTPPQQVYFACKGSIWSDFYVYNWVEMVQKYGINGIYLDSTFNPYFCKNPYHGHAYRSSAGENKGVMAIRDARNFAKRMVTALRKVDPDFYFFGHGYDPFISRFLDYSMTGENYWLSPPNVELPLDYMRVVFSKQWGTPITFYPGPIVAQPYARPIALLHDIAISTSGGLEYEAWAKPVYQIWEDFKIDQAKFVGYWKKSPYVTSSNPDVKASYYVKSGNVLLIVATAKRLRPDATIKVDLKGLGLDPAVITIKTEKGKIDIKPDSDGFLSVRFPEHTDQGLYLWLSSIN